MGRVQVRMGRVCLLRECVTWPGMWPRVCCRAELGVPQAVRIPDLHRAATTTQQPYFTPGNNRPRIPLFNCSPREQDLKAEIERVNLEVSQAERDYDLNRAAELKYGTLMNLQKQLKVCTRFRARVLGLIFGPRCFERSWSTECFRTCRSS